MASSMDMGAIADWFEHRPINAANRSALADKLRSRLGFVGIEWADQNGKEVRMLDYACGPGFLSRIFAPHVSSITAIDTSQAMIDRYIARIPELGPKHKDTQVVLGNLLSDPIDPPSLASEEFFNFELITVGAALHAFPDSSHAVKALAERLAPGGVLYVQDKFDDGGERGEGAKGPKGPKGFTEVGTRELMGDAGLVDSVFELVEGELEIELLSEEVVGIQVFVARGRKLG